MTVERYIGSIENNPSPLVQSAFFEFANFAFQRSAQTGDNLAYLRTKRKIGNIALPAVFEERHTDTIKVTSHPIQYGAPISDHMYPDPAKLTVITGISDCIVANYFQNTVSSWLTKFSSSDTISDQFFPESGTGTPSILFYNAFLDIKNNREPVSVTTTKRNYPTMVVTDIRVTTDLTTNYTSIIELDLQEIFIANFQTVSIPPEDQKEVKKTGSTSNNGDKQTQQTKPSSWAYESEQTIRGRS